MTEPVFLEVWKNTHAQLIDKDQEIARLNDELTNARVAAQRADDRTGELQAELDRLRSDYASLLEIAGRRSIDPMNSLLPSASQIERQ